MNFELVGTFDTSLIEYEVYSTTMWNWLNLRKRRGLNHQAVDDIVLRFQSIEGFHSPMEYFDSLECVDLFTKYLFPQTIRAVDEFANGRTIGKIVIAKLKPNGLVEPHIDEGKYCAAYDRYHFVVSTNPDAHLKVNDEVRHFNKGEIFWLDNKAPHSAFNYGKSDRIHIIVDLK
jgi:hypothetical protein